MKTIAIKAVLIVLFLCTGCSLILDEDTDDNTTPTEDAGMDTADAVDTGVDVKEDAGSDAAEDSGSDAGENCPDTCAAPAPFCDGNNVITYSNGTRSEDGCTCAFNTTAEPCEEGASCEDGACVNPCDSVQCNPPAPYCDGDTYVVFGAGTCSVTDGTANCSYDSTPTVCEDGATCIPGDSGGCRLLCDGPDDCPEGQLCDTGSDVSYCVQEVGLCDAVFCPAETCSDVATQATYATEGVCNELNGQCEYAGDPVVTACADGQCDDGVCIATCGGQTCNPDEICVGEDDQVGCGEQSCQEASECGDSRSVCFGGTCRLRCSPENNTLDCPGQAEACDPQGYCIYAG